MNTKTGTKRIIAITGGIGGAKLALGLSKLLAGDELAMVVNTGDDFRHLGLHISPDIDTLVYTLAGLSNPQAGWGRRDETWNFMEALAGLGGETWFALGDKDLAMNVERTRRLAAGKPLSKVTAELAASLGIAHVILPMTDDPVHTRVRSGDVVLDFQHYFVRDKCEPVVSGFEFQGADLAAFNPEIERWMDSPDCGGIILCPSNPFVSIDPILALPGLRDRLRSCAAPVVAVSPIVGGSAIKGPTAKMMRELNIPASATRVAGHYRDFLDGFILDERDSALRSEVEALGLECEVTNTVMATLEDRVHLAKRCLGLLGRLRRSRHGEN
jgi:LPPG:FO 2-phospho-L-lactate transferase